MDRYPTNTPIRNPNDTTGRRQALRTPRFVFGSSQPASSGAGAASPFVATPRFLLGTQTRLEDDVVNDGDDIEASDTELPSTMGLPTSVQSRRGRQSHAPEGDEIIPDSEDDDDGVVHGQHEPNMDEDGMEIRDMQEEYDLLFSESPTQPEPQAKRRRISESSTHTRQVRQGPPETEFNTPLSPDREGPSVSMLGTRESPEQVDDTITSPPPTRRPQPPSTPMAATSSQFHPPSARRPRFMLNASQYQQQRPSTSTNTADLTPTAPLQQPHPTSQSTVPAPQSTPKRRPHFVLPLTPSRHDPTNSTQQIPQHQQPLQSRTDPLFSPSTTRTTGRPGRPSNRRSAGQDYISGGMAAHVRNWIFELQANRQATQAQMQPQPQTQQASQHAPSKPGREAGAASTQSDSPAPNSKSRSQEKYYLTAEINDVATSLLSRINAQLIGPGHPAPTTLVTPSTSTPTSTYPNEIAYSKILLFGSPLSAPPTFSSIQTREGKGNRLRRGDWVGVRRGVVWEMEISSLAGHGDQCVSGNDSGQSDKMEKWLVSVDWDILPRVDPTVG